MLFPVEHALSMICQFRATTMRKRMDFQIRYMDSARRKPVGFIKNFVSSMVQDGFGGGSFIHMAQGKRVES